MKKIRLHKQSVFFGLGLMLFIAVFFNQLFNSIISFFTAVKVSVFGGARFTGLDGHRTVIDDSGARSPSSSSSSSSSAGVYDTNDSYSKKMYSIWGLKIKPQFDSMFKSEFETYCKIPIAYEEFKGAVESGLKSYIAWVQTYADSSEKVKEFDKMSASSKLQKAVTFAVSSSSFSSMRNRFISEMSEKSMDKLKWQFGENSPLLGVVKAVQKGSYLTLDEYLNALIQNAFLKLNQKYANAWTSLF